MIEIERSIRAQGDGVAGSDWTYFELRCDRCGALENECRCAEEPFPTHCVECGAVLTPAEIAALCVQCFGCTVDADSGR